MKPEDVNQIIADNQTLVNIGGHYFEGQTKHDRQKHGLPQMADLIPFEEQGLIRRVYAFNGIGKRYVSAFIRCSDTAVPPACAFCGCAIHDMRIIWVDSRPCHPECVGPIEDRSPPSFDVAGAGKLVITRYGARTGSAVGCGVRVSWGRHGMAGGIMDIREVVRLRDYLSEQIAVWSKPREKPNVSGEQRPTETSTTERNPENE